MANRDGSTERDPSGAARVRYVENDPDESHWIMADPEGNEFCCSRPPWEPRPDRVEAEEQPQ